MELPKPIHTLKIYPAYFQLMKFGIKKFEVRKNDRDFKTHDLILFREYDPKTDMYTGQFSFQRITYILPGGQFGIEKDYVVMQLKKI